jgi:hypothetical protein
MVLENNARTSGVDPLSDIFISFLGWVEVTKVRVALMCGAFK